MNLKGIVVILFLSLGYTMFSQDEYNKNKKVVVEEEEEIQTKSDSIVVKNQPVPEDKKEAESTVKERSMFMENLRLGGGFDLSSYYEAGINKTMLYVSVNPQATVMLSDVFEGGIQLGYTYFGTFSDINQHFFKAGPILRAHFLETFFLQVEGTAFYTMTDYKFAGIESSKDFINFNAFVGGGYVSKISDRAYVLSGIKVNLMKNALTYNQILPVPFVTFHFGI